jgi:hypothetical protein
MTGSDYKDAAVQFLSKPENLEVALDVAELLEDVKDKLVLEFWHKLKERVSEKLSEPLTWSFKLDSDEELLKGRYPGLDCVPGIAPNAQHFLRFRLEQGGDKISQGVCWNVEMKTPFDKLSEGVPQLRRIRDRLQPSEGYSSKVNTWWVGYKYLNNSQRLREKTSLLRMQAGTLANEVADEFVELAKGLQKLVEEANSALAKIDPASVK